MSRRTLVLLRHAKSSWPEGVADIERPLGARGTRDAAAVGQWLAERIPKVDLVLCSPSVRTRRTWALAADELSRHRDGSGAAPVRRESDIYLATPQALLELIRAVDDTVETLVVVGHNPGTQDLALRLAGSGEADQLEAMRAKYPTAALAVLEINGSWAELAKGDGRLVAFAAPRG